MQIANLEGDFMSTIEAAQELQLTPHTLRVYLGKGLLVGEKQGRDWAIPVEEVKRYQQERKPKGRPRSNA